MTPQAHEEIELKFRVPALFTMPELTTVPGVAKAVDESHRSLSAVYHDTPDLRLFRWGITLRRRTGGPDAGWHLKLPVPGAGGSVREEIHLPLSAGKVGRVPAELANLVRAVRRDAELVPVVTLQTERTPITLIDDDGNDLAEVVDDTVSVLNGKAVAAKFREVEVEAASGKNEEDLAEVADLIASHGGTPSTVSKAADALGAPAQAPADIVETPPAGPEDPAEAAIRALISKHAHRFVVQDIRVRRDLPDSVHQMRVAARRLRSGLQAFGPLLDKAWAKDLRTELKWIAGELSAVRDTEVLIERLAGRAAALPADEQDLATAAIDAALRQQFTDARTQAIAALNSDRYVRLQVALAEAVQSPKLTAAAAAPCVEAIPPLVEKTYRRLRRDVAGLQTDSIAAPWHEARITAKKARYTAEAAQPIFGDKVKPLVKALESVTELLGDHQDAHVAQQALRQLAVDCDGPAGFALGMLYTYEVDYEIALRDEFRRVWPKVEQTHKKTDLTDG